MKRKKNWVSRRLTEVIQPDDKFTYWACDVVEAAVKLVECKGRFHAELNYIALESLVKKEPK